MKNILLPIIAVSALLASCSSIYKSGQTPDDLYYSESPVIVRSENSRNATAGDDYAYTEDGEYRSLWGESDDNYLRQKVSNGGKWKSIDDNDYWNGYVYDFGGVYNPYMFGNTYNTFNNYWNRGFNNYTNYWGFSPMSYGWGIGTMMNPYYSMYSGFNSMYAFNRFGGMYGMYNPYGYGYNNYGSGFYNYGGKNATPVYRNATRPSSLSRYSNNNGFSRGLMQSASSSSVSRNPVGTFRSVNGNSNNNNSNGSTFERATRTFNTGSGNSGGSFGGGSSSGSSRTSGSSNASRGGRN